MSQKDETTKFFDCVGMEKSRNSLINSRTKVALDAGMLEQNRSPPELNHCGEPVMAGSRQWLISWTTYKQHQRRTPQHADLYQTACRRTC